MNIMDWPVPEIPITPLTPSHLPTPTAAGSELKPPVPEKEKEKEKEKEEPWSEIPSLQDTTDEYEDLTINPLNYNHKRSSMLHTFFFFSSPPSMYDEQAHQANLFKTGQDQGPFTMVPDRASSSVAVPMEEQQQLDGRGMKCPVEVVFLVFLLLFIGSLVVALIWSIRSERRLSRYMARHLEELGQRDGVDDDDDEVVVMEEWERENSSFAGESEEKKEWTE